MASSARSAETGTEHTVGRLPLLLVLMATVVATAVLSDASADADGYHSTGGVYSPDPGSCDIAAVLGYDNIHPHISFTYTYNTPADPCRYIAARLVVNFFGSHYVSQSPCVFGAGGGALVSPAHLYGNPVNSVNWGSGGPCNFSVTVHWSPLPRHP